MPPVDVELDESLGVASLDREGRFTSVSGAFAALVGRSCDELRGVHFTEVIPSEELGAEIDLVARLHSDREAHQIECRYVAKDGERRWGRVILARPAEGSGAASSVVLVLENLTERRRTAQRLAAQHAVAHVLAESASLRDATPRILQAICESLDWDVGALWIVDRTINRIRFVEAWSRPGVHIPDFIARSQEMVARRGEGLPGHTWRLGTPVWIEDMPHSGPVFMRGPVAASEGLHGAIAFPILFGRRVLAVMDFFTNEIRRPDRDVIEMLMTFGSQIGQFMERKRAEEALRAHEERLQSIIDNTTAIVYVTDLSGRIALMNRRCERLFRGGSEDICGRMLRELQPPALSDVLCAQHERALKSGQLMEEEEILPAPDGLRTYLSHRFFLHDPGGRESAVCSVLTDITERKRAEDHLRSLAAQLSDAEDEQRRRLARDLHDSVGQTLTALQMQLLRSLRSDAPQGGPAAETRLEATVRDSLDLVEQLIAQIRSMTFDLYPTMLEDLGLVPTLHSFAEQFSARSGIKASVTEVGERVPLAITVTNYLFRATKELLNNVVKHAHAGEVLIAVHWGPRAVRILVADDGVGFDPEEALATDSRRGLGLADIRERVQFLGGGLLLDSEQGRGSRIVIELPLAGTARG